MPLRAECPAADFLFLFLISLFGEKRQAEGRVKPPEAAGKIKRRKRGCRELKLKTSLSLSFSKKQVS
jgi:hypothetical protein